MRAALALLALILAIFLLYISGVDAQAYKMQPTDERAAQCNMNAGQYLYAFGQDEHQLTLAQTEIERLNQQIDGLNKKIEELAKKPKP